MLNLQRIALKRFCLLLSHNKRQKRTRLQYIDTLASRACKQMPRWLAGPTDFSTFRACDALSVQRSMKCSASPVGPRNCRPAAITTSGAALTGIALRYKIAFPHRVYRVLLNSFDKTGCTASLVSWCWVFHLLGNPLGWQFLGPTGPVNQRGISCPRNQTNATRSRATKPFARRLRRGFNLIETSLAIGITVVALNSGLQVWSNYVFRKSLDTEAQQVSNLAAAAKQHVLFDIKGHIRWTRLNTNRTYDLTIADLVGTGSYPPTAPRSTVRRRNLSIFLWAPTSTSLVIVTQAKFPDGVTGRLGAPRHTSTGTPIGWVPPYAPTRLEGAGLYYDIEHLQDVGRAFKPGDFVSLEYISNTRDVLPYLHRISDPDNPELTRMDADLDMNGNSLLNVESITAEILTVTATLNAEKITGDLTVLGDVTIEGNIEVSETLDVSGGTVLSNGITAGDLTVSQTLTTNSVKATTATVTDLTVDTLVANDRITGTELYTNTLVANNIAVDHGTATLIETETLLVNGNTTAVDVVTTTLTTGSCTGC